MIRELPLRGLPYNKTRAHTGPSRRRQHASLVLGAPPAHLSELLFPLLQTQADSCSTSQGKQTSSRPPNKVRLLWRLRSVCPLALTDSPSRLTEAMGMPGEAGTPQFSLSRYQPGQRAAAQRPSPPVFARVSL